MEQNLNAAQRGEQEFRTEDYINKIPVKKHDHVLIPAGTVHCAGAGTMVLEISATPYIFTFKMWDWGRVGLDKKPRPIHLDRGIENIQWDRDTEWVENNLVNCVTEIYQDETCQIERTGLHEREFIDTYRVSTSSHARIRRNGSVHVVNLVGGKEAILKSTEGKFPPFILHYAETCIIPEAAGEYDLVSDKGETVKMIVACVRE
jgi:mannose-6-phosphate isomerase class I